MIVNCTLPLYISPCFINEFLICVFIVGIQNKSSNDSSFCILLSGDWVHQEEGSLYWNLGSGIGFPARQVKCIGRVYWNTSSSWLCLAVMHQKRDPAAKWNWEMDGRNMIKWSVTRCWVWSQWERGMSGQRMCRRKVPACQDSSRSWRWAVWRGWHFEGGKQSPPPQHPGLQHLSQHDLTGNCWNRGHVNEGGVTDKKKCFGSWWLTTSISGEIHCLLLSWTHHGFGGDDARTKQLTCVTGNGTWRWSVRCEASNLTEIWTVWWPTFSVKDAKPVFGFCVRMSYRWNLDSRHVATSLFISISFLSNSRPQTWKCCTTKKISSLGINSALKKWILCSEIVVRIIHGYKTMKKCDTEVSSKNPNYKYSIKEFTDPVLHVCLPSEWHIPKIKQLHISIIIACTNATVMSIVGMSWNKWVHSRTLHHVTGWRLNKSISY